MGATYIVGVYFLVFENTALSCTSSYANHIWNKKMDADVYFLLVDPESNITGTWNWINSICSRHIAHRINIIRLDGESSDQEIALVIPRAHCTI